MIEIAPGLAIPDGEITFTASRSGGPGGQNVNKVATRVTLAFDVAGSSSLSAAQRSLIQAHLATRIGRDGRLRIVSQRHRTQGANRRAALERFLVLVREALAEREPRVPTHPHHASREHRVAAKKRRARVKETRRRPELDEP